MKLIASLLVTVGLILGSISAATAYLKPVEGAPLDKFARDGGFVELNAPAGAIPKSEQALADLRASYEAGLISAEQYVAQREASAPVGARNAELTPELVGTLQSADVRYARVKEFSFFDWPHWWLFTASAGVLLLGSLMLRAAGKAAVAAATASEKHETETPQYALRQVDEAIRSLRAELPSMSGEKQKLRAIVDRIGEAQRTHLASFVEARPLLIGKLGLGGFAELMDRFAAAERQINRAWSAAADNHLEEAEICLDRAAELMGPALEKLPPDSKRPDEPPVRQAPLA